MCGLYLYQLYSMFDVTGFVCFSTCRFFGIDDSKLVVRSTHLCFPGEIFGALPGKDGSIRAIPEVESEVFAAALDNVLRHVVRSQVEEAMLLRRTILTAAWGF